MNRGNIWITVGIILLLCLCHSLLTGIYPVKTLFPTSKETTDRRTDSRRNLRKQPVDRRIANVGFSEIVPSHNGQLLATTKRNVVWNEPTQIELRSFKDGSIVRTLEGSGRFGGSVFSPDDSLIAASTFNDIHIWRTDNGQLLRKIPTTSLYSSGSSVNFSSDGKKLISCGKKRISRGKKFVPDLEEKQIVAWDVTSGQRFYSLDVQEQNVSVSPDGKSFAVGSYASFMKLYHLDDGTLLRQLSLTGYPRFVSDDKILISTISGGNGSRVLLYHIKSDTTSPELFGLVSNLLERGSFSPDGRFLLAGAGGGGESGGDFFVAVPRIPPPKVVAYILWQVNSPYPLPLKKFFVRWGQSPRWFTSDSNFLLGGGDLFRLPLVHPWLANAQLVLSVTMVIFFADRFPPIR